MDSEKKPSEPVRLEVEVLIDAIDTIEEKADDVPETGPSDVTDPDGESSAPVRW